MLTEKQYQSLCKFRDAPIPVTDCNDELTEYFIDSKFIMIMTIEYTEHYECEATYEKSVFVLTTCGKRALSKFEEHIENQREKEAKLKDEQTAEEKQLAMDAKKKFNRDVAIAIIGSAVGGLIVLAVQNWSAIVGFLTNLLQNLSPP